MSDTTTENGFVRPFADFLLEAQGGRTHAELSEALQQIAAAVVDTRKAGSLTLTFKIAPLDKGKGDALVITDVIKAVVPQHDRRKSVFFADPSGNLTRDDPSQPTFDGLQVVETPNPPEARDLPARPAAR